MNILNNDYYKCKVGHKDKDNIILSCGRVESFQNFFESSLNSLIDTKISFSNQIELKCDCSQGSHHYPLSELTKTLQDEISRTNLRKCINHKTKRIHAICNICNEELCEQCAMFHRLKCITTNISIKNKDETLSKILKSECHIRDEIYKLKEKMLYEIEQCIEALMTLKRKVECNYDTVEKENYSFFNYLKSLYHYTSYRTSFPNLKDICLMDESLSSFNAMYSEVHSFRENINSFNNFPSMKYMINFDSESHLINKETIKKEYELKLPSEIRCIYPISDKEIAISDLLGNISIYDKKFHLIDKISILGNKSMINYMTAPNENVLIASNDENMIYYFTRKNNQFALTYNTEQKVSYNIKRNSISGLFAIDTNKFISSMMSCDVNVFSIEDNSFKSSLKFSTRGQITSLLQSHISNDNEVIFGTQRGDLVSWNISNNTNVPISSFNNCKVISINKFKDRTIIATSNSSIKMLKYNDKKYIEIFTMNTNYNILACNVYKGFLLMRSFDNIKVHCLREDSIDKKMIKEIDIYVSNGDSTDDSEQSEDSYEENHIIVMNDMFGFVNKEEGVVFYQ